MENRLLEILACPKCKGSVERAVNEEGVICRRCELLYPEIDQILVMLVEKAKHYPATATENDNG